MRLSRARIQDYRSIRDSDWFEVESQKSILVGPNEAGKTALLRALEHVHSGVLVKPFVALRDYPRSAYDELRRGRIDTKDVLVVDAVFELDDEDRGAVNEIAPSFANCRYERLVYMDNNWKHALLEAPERPTFGSITDSIRRLAVHADGRMPAPAEGAAASAKPSERLAELLSGGAANTYVAQTKANELLAWLDETAPYVDDNNGAEMQRLADLRDAMETVLSFFAVLTVLADRTPVFVYFNTYTRVTPLLHLGHLADALDAGAIDESDTYNFGNACLLKLLGFSARELSNLGKATEPARGDETAFEEYRAKLDERHASLNAASLTLTRQIRDVWQPGENETSDYTIRIVADQEYLKVVVEDSLGVEVELDQRSEGFQWLVSFFIVFFAQAADDLQGAILLLDEPGLSLHGLKQREFRKTLSRLAEGNQLIFTTHSPFLVGPDELNLVRVVEMTDREVGTKVHADVVATDPASLLPLQEALGYDLAQSLFAQQRNLILEGLTDYWYVEAVASLLRDSGDADLNDKIALVPASGAGKVVYFATILHAHQLKVAALLDSDSAGEQAAQQEVLVHTLGNKRILRTKDAYTGPVANPEIEDLLRETLVAVALDDLGWDVTAAAASQPGRPVVELFATEVQHFSKYKLAKAFLRWTRDHGAADITADERAAFVKLIDLINKATK